MRRDSASNWTNRSVARIWRTASRSSSEQSCLPVEQDRRLAALDPRTVARLDEEEIAWLRDDDGAVFHQVAHAAGERVLAVVHRAGRQAVGVGLDLVVPAPAGRELGPPDALVVDRDARGRAV